MRTDEEFVARALVEFLGGQSIASAVDGEDPPDLYIKIGASRTGVEVTRLSQFTFNADGTQGNRATQDTFGSRLLGDLNRVVGPSVPHEINLMVCLWMPVENASLFRKSLMNRVAQVAAAATVSNNFDGLIEGARVTVSVIPDCSSGNKIMGVVANSNSSADIGMNARMILEDRIATKSKICTTLAKPIWLALLNDYWIADADSYARAYRQSRLDHCFERIFLVSGQGTVSELTVSA